MDFKSRFFELLKDNEISARKLGEMLNIDHSSIYSYLKESYPNLTNANKLANHFDCSLNYLFGLHNFPKDVEFKNSYNPNLFYDRYILELKEQNLSHYKVINQLNLGNSSFRKWKLGSEPKIETLIKISKFLNVSIDYLIGRSDLK